MRARNNTDKATHSQIRQHNQQLLLRAVYSGLADNRAALAHETGLAKPTVSELVGELINDGLLIEEGWGPSTEGGGKRPRLLKFVPEARHVIGISLNEERIFGALAILNGQIVARHYLDLAGSQGDEVIDLIVDVINGLRAQLDAPLLCIQIGVSGIVDADAGIVNYAPHLGWYDLHLAELLSERCGLRVYVANSTELGAMAQYVYGSAGGVNSLATVRVGGGVGVGLVVGGVPYHGGGEIGYLRIAEHSRVETPDETAGRLETFLGWPYVKQRAYTLSQMYPGGLLPEASEDLTYLHIRYAAANGDQAALMLCDELSATLAQVFAWIIGLLRPDHISLAGPITDLGEALLEQTIDHTQKLISPNLVERVSFSLTESSNLVAVGAIARALQLELGLV